MRCSGHYWPDSRDPKTQRKRGRGGRCSLSTSLRLLENREANRAQTGASVPSQALHLRRRHSVITYKRHILLVQSGPSLVNQNPTRSSLVMRLTISSKWAGVGGKSSIRNIQRARDSGNSRVQATIPRATRPFYTSFMLAAVSAALDIFTCCQNRMATGRLRIAYCFGSLKTGTSFRSPHKEKTRRRAGSDVSKPVCRF